VTGDDGNWNPGSRLPDDPGYWDDLAGRIAARSAPVIDTWGAERTRWWSWLADFSPALAAAAVLAMAATWAFAPAAQPVDPDAALPRVGEAIAPTDPMARALLADSTPPAIAGLAWTGAEGGSR